MAHQAELLGDVISTVEKQEDMVRDLTAANDLQETKLLEPQLTLNEIQKPCNNHNVNVTWAILFQAPKVVSCMGTGRFVQLSVVEVLRLDSGLAATLTLLTAEQIVREMPNMNDPVTLTLVQVHICFLIYFSFV